jgi:hypothetical protein
LAALISPAAISTERRRALEGAIGGEFADASPQPSIVGDGVGVEFDAKAWTVGHS